MGEMEIKNPLDVQQTQRSISIEHLVIGLVEKENLPKPLIKEIFKGIASVKTLESIISESLILNQEDLIISAAAIHKANIKYTFKADAQRAKIWIGGQLGKEGEDLSLPNVKLAGDDYEIEIRVRQRGLGNWKLDIKEILVVGPGSEHKRKMKSNPIDSDGSRLISRKTSKIKSST